mmetsp:Transcript_20853/g.42005  ORF Transcript_20853/g.42005 Transcript_20853/m.42005 type:complete len:134 (-) Transcript_20853:45-446(-)
MIHRSVALVVFIVTATTSIEAFAPSHVPFKLIAKTYRSGVQSTSISPNSLLPKQGGRSGFELRKWRPNGDKEKKSTTLWEQFKAEFSEEGKGTMFEQMHHYFVDLVTVTLGAYMAMLLLSDIIKLRSMSLGVL